MTTQPQPQTKDTLERHINDYEPSHVVTNQFFKCVITLVGVPEDFATAPRIVIRARLHDHIARFFGLRQTDPILYVTENHFEAYLTKHNAEAADYSYACVDIPDLDIKGAMRSIRNNIASAVEALHCLVQDQQHTTEFEQWIAELNGRIYDDFYNN